MKDLKNQFPVAQSYTYLNTASCGLLSYSLVDWRHSHDKNLMQGGSLFRDLHKDHIKMIRESVARFFNAQNCEVALVPNFSFGINVILDALPKGKKVLLLEGDYPSVNWPFERRDFDICTATIDEHLEANIIAAIKKYNPDILAFSVVQYISGIAIDLDFINELKQLFPSLLIIADGTQFLGTKKFDFSTSGIDILGASCYKWMLSGYGNGVFLIKESIQSKLHPETVGFNSADASFNKKNAIEFVGHLEPGHQDTLNYGSLGESISFLESIGISAIENHLQALCGAVFQALKERDLLMDIAANRSNYSTIFNIKGDEELFQKLKDHHIICSLRGRGIRVSFHIYNTKEDLNTLLQVIDEVLTK